MVLCLFHVSIIMNRLSPVTGILTSCPCSFKLHNRDSKLVGCGFGLQRKERLKRKLKFVVSAELSKSFSVNLGLDSKVILLLTLWFLSDLFVFFLYLFRLNASESNGYLFFSCGQEWHDFCDLETFTREYLMLPVLKLLDQLMGFFTEYYDRTSIFDWHFM
jgi:hypothetical protein